MADTFDIVVAGGGPVGLALAVAVAKFSDGALTVAVCDPAFGADRSGRVSAIAPGSRNMLDALDVWERLEGSAQPVRRMVISDSRAADVVRPPFLSFDEEADGEPVAHLLTNADIESALEEQARALDVRLVRAQARDYEAGASTARMTLLDGGAMRARLLVAADGRRSRLRSLAGIETTGWDYGVSGIVATIGHERDHDGVARQHFLPAGPFAALPLTGRRSSSVWNEPHARARQIVAMPPAEFIAELESRFGLELGALELLDRPVAWPLVLQVAKSFVAPRLALLGDAAHVIHPIAGQGLNLAYRSVATLAEEIVGQARLGLDPGAPEPLETYQRRRRFDAMTTGLGMDVLHRLFANDVTAIRLVRDLGLGLVDRARPLKKLFMREAAGTSGDAPLLLQGLPI